jgi:tight adherence protein B
MSISASVTMPAMAASLAGVLTAAAVLVWGGLPGSLLLWLRGIAPVPANSRSTGIRRRLHLLVARKPSVASVLIVLATGAVIGATFLGVDREVGVGALRGLLIAGALLAGWAAVAHRSVERAYIARTDRWREACEVMAAQLRAGRSPPQALEAAAEACAELEPAARQLRLGGNVPAVLRDIESSPAAAGLASAWATAEVSGSALAGVVERVVSELLAQQEIRREVDEQLAGPRATARLLAVLPMAGIGLGFVLGVDVPQTLLSTLLSLCCLSVGFLLALVGLVWVERLVAGMRP